MPRGVVLADAAYGVEAHFRSTISTHALLYAVGVKSTTTVWAPGTSAKAPPAYSGRGRRPVRPVHDDDDHKPVSVEKLALQLPDDAWRKITWRQGTNERLSGRFARVRVRSAHDRDAATEKIPEEWLLIEWPEDEEKPTKYFLSTLDATVTFAHLVHVVKQRWRIERDYLELKQEIGLGHFEGRPSGAWLHQDAGEGFIITPRFASPHMDSWCPKGRLFPLRNAWRRALRSA